MPPKVLQYQIADQFPYKVELHLTEAEAGLFRHFLGNWEGQARCSHHNDAEDFAYALRRRADDAGFPRAHC